MTFLDLCDRNGLADPQFQAGLINGYLVQHEPFLLIRSGQDAERDQVAAYRRQHGLPTSIPCFRTDAIDQYYASFAPGEIAAFQRGLICEYRPKRPKLTEFERLKVFIDQMLDDDHEAVLLPNLAAPIRRLISGEFAQESVIAFDLVRAWQGLQIIGRDADMEACCAEVLMTRAPLLLWFFPDFKSPDDLRLAARRVDHWMVPPPAAAAFKQT